MSRSSNCGVGNLLGCCRALAVSNVRILGLSCYCSKQALAAISAHWNSANNIWILEGAADTISQCIEQLYCQERVERIWLKESREVGCPGFRKGVNRITS